MDNPEENAPKYQLRIPSHAVDAVLPNSLYEVVAQATDNQQTSENEQNNQQQ